MPFEFTVADVVPAPTQDVYATWLDSAGHAAMTGGKAAAIAAQEGTRFSAWNGYITGRILWLEPARRIVQSWRTAKFTPQDADSIVELALDTVPGGTRVTVHHRNVPDGHTSYRDGGWQDNYFEPMKRYFGARR